MRIVWPAPTEWEQEITCDECGVVFIAESEDVKAGGFKREKGTYWWDGTASEITRFYVNCPTDGCYERFYVDGRIEENGWPAVDADNPAPLAVCVEALRVANEARTWGHPLRMPS